MDKTLRERGTEVLSYGPTAGYGPLRETIAQEMSRKGTPCEAASILVTNGSQQALELAFRAFVDPGDAVVVEDPTYTGAISALAALGARPVGVPLDDQGLRPDLLELALERHRPRLLYVQPTFHNPTARVMGEARRRDILAIAERHRCIIVEDDYASDLRFEGRDLPTLHALDGGKHVLDLSTFSKKLLPGLRVGWVTAPEPVFERLLALKQIEDCGTSPLVQAALAAFIASGSQEDHLARVRSAYLSRSRAMDEAIRIHFPEGARFTRPRVAVPREWRRPQHAAADVRVGRRRPDPSRDPRVGRTVGPALAERPGHAPREEFRGRADSLMTPGGLRWGTPTKERRG
jgi:DNA-binding transcriptional MocR family regulator